MRQAMNQEMQKEDLCLAILSLSPSRPHTSSFFQEAAAALGIEASLLHLYFPHGVQEVLETFAQWADRKMIEMFKETAGEGERTPEKVKRALLGRFRLMTPYHGALKVLWVQGLLHPLATTTSIFGIADAVWKTLGDQSTDFNYYTKRGLLGTVYGATFLYWIKVGPDRLGDVETFLEARLKNVLIIPKIKSTIMRFFGLGATKEQQ